MCEDICMVKPIKSGVPQAIPETTKNEQASSTNAQPVEIPAVQKTVGYNDAGRAGRRAERAMEGQAQAAKLLAQLQQAQGGSMMLPRMKWEVNVDHSDNSAVPTPYPNIANANKKDEPKK